MRAAIALLLVLLLLSFSVSSSIGLSQSIFGDIFKSIKSTGKKFVKKVQNLFHQIFGGSRPQTKPKSNPETSYKPPKNNRNKQSPSNKNKPPPDNPRKPSNSDGPSSSGSSGSGGNWLNKIINFFLPEKSLPNQNALSLGNQVKDFVLNTPFDDQTGNKTSSSLLLGGLSLAGGLGVGLFFGRNAIRDALNYTSAALAGFKNKIGYALSPKSGSIKNTLSKIARGWGYKFGGARDWVVKTGSKIWSDIQNIDPADLVKRAKNTIVGAAHDFANWQAENFQLLAKGNISGFLYKQIEPFIHVAKAGASFVTNVVHAYVRALERDPIDTIAKTAIVVGGLIMAIPSFGSSFILAGSIAAAGTATMIVQESYEYARSKTEEELKENALEDVDDLVWIVGGALTAAHGTKLYQVTRFTKTFEGNPEEINMFLRKEGLGSLESCPSGATIVTKENGKKVYILVKNTESKVYKNNPIALEAHERFGELGIEKGVVKAPEWVKRDPVLRDIAADKAAARFIGKDAFAKTNHNWWAFIGQERYIINGKERVLNPEIIKNVMRSTKIAFWYNPKLSTGTSATLIGQALAKR